MTHSPRLTVRPLSAPVLTLLALLASGLFVPSASAQQVGLRKAGDDAQTGAPKFGPDWVMDVHLVPINDHQPQLKVNASTDDGSPYLELYVREFFPPTSTAFNAKADAGEGPEELVLNGGTRPVLKSSVYWVGVRHDKGSSYSLDIDLSPIPSNQPGMGSLPYGPKAGAPLGGTAFRVWAPFATEVHLAGSFNGWNGSTVPMASEGNGNWSLDYRDVGPGAQYKYVITSPYGTFWRNDPRAEQVTNSIGNSVVYDREAYNWTDAGFNMPPWNELVIYQMHVGTFNDAPGGTPGSFASAIERLDMVQELGANAIKLLPVAEFAGDFSWGYNYGHPFAVETAYGGPDELKRFVDEAHDRGIAVLLDVLYNHWGPQDLDLWQFDGWNLDGKGGIYFYQDINAETQWGPRPDFGRPEVRQYIRDNVLMWTQEFHIDGFRFDSTSNIHKGPGGDIPAGWSLLQWVNDEINNTQPWKISIAEDFQNNDWISKSTGEGGAGFDAQWDGNFVHPIRGAVITPNDADRNMWSVRDAILYSYNGDAFQRVIYTESHDEVANGSSRVPEEIFPGNADSWFSKKRSTLAGAIVLTSPGIPMMFQGQELLEDEYFQDTDPIDWNKADTFAGIRSLYQDLIRLRRNWFDNTRGLRGQNTNVFQVNDFDKLIAFHRWDQGGPGDDVVVIANFSNKTWNGDYRIGLPRDGEWKVRFNSDWDGYDAEFDNHPAYDLTAENIPWNGLPYSANIHIGPYTCIILSQ